MYKFFHWKTGSGASVNEDLAEELQKSVIKKFNRFKDDFWTADLAKMGLLTSFNHGVKYLVYLIYVCTKYARVKPLKD